MAYNIPQKYINKLAKVNKIKYFRRDMADVIEDLKHDHQAELDYLHDIFQYSSKFLTLMKPESNFPDIAQTPVLFINKMISEGEVTLEQVNKQWQPSLTDKIKVCSVKHDGSVIYLKFVVGKKSIKKNGWGIEHVRYPYIVPVAIDFQNQLIEIRCSQTELGKYKDHVMGMMGFAKPYKAFPVPKLTKEAAEALCKILSAGVISSHIALSSTVGSVRFNGIKGIDLNKDQKLKEIKEAFQSIGLSTNDTMDQEVVFNFKDPRTKIDFDVYLYVDIVDGYFKFKEEVNETVIDHVKEALLKVTEQDNGDLTGDEIAVKVVVQEVLAGKEQAAIGAPETEGQIELDLN